MSQLDLHEAFNLCPYCGERISLLIDNSEESQQYIEDCEVCCRPITVITRRLDDEHFDLTLLPEDEVS